MHHVTLPKLGRIRIGASPKLLKALRERTCDTRIGSICISRDSVGEYWASFSLSPEEPSYETLPKTGKMHGIDLNLIELVDTSDGSASENRRYRRQIQKKLSKVNANKAAKLNTLKRQPVVKDIGTLPRTASEDRMHTSQGGTS